MALAGPAFAACPEHHPGGRAPAITRPALAEQAQELCFAGFAVLHSGLSRTPLAVAERLTRADLEGARRIPRSGSFHEEERLPPRSRARLEDYARSGFNRGHMAPAGDMATPAEQEESFSLANIVPQHPQSNRNLWEAIERAVRGLVERDGEAFVLTGPLFEGEELRRIGGRVLVPTGLWKAVWVPSRGVAGAYVAPNGPGWDWQALSVAALSERAGIELFPAIPAAARAIAMALPEPRARGSAAPPTPELPPVSFPGEVADPHSDAAITALALLAAVVVSVLLWRALGRR